MRLGDLRARETTGHVIPGSQVVVVFSPKGGVGKTLLATSIALVASRRAGRKTLLVDMDLDSGDVSVHLDLDLQSSINDLLPYCSDLSAEVMSRFCAQHKAGGIDVVLAPPRPELAEFVKTEHTISLLDGARKLYQCIVLDTPPCSDCDLIYECLEKSDTQVLVVTQDLACLRQARTSVELLRRLGLDVANRSHVVVNRYSDRSLLSLRKIVDFLGLERVVTVADDRETVERCILDGTPLVLSAGASGVARDIGAAAASILEIAGDSPRAVRPVVPWFGRLRRQW
jgi:pilus assembly protein CpaE